MNWGVCCGNNARKESNQIVDVSLTRSQNTGYILSLSIFLSQTFPALCLSKTNIAATEIENAENRHNLVAYLSHILSWTKNDKLHTFSLSFSLSSQFASDSINSPRITSIHRFIANYEKVNLVNEAARLKQLIKHEINLKSSGLSTWKYVWSYDHWSQATLSLVSTWMRCYSSVAWVLLLTLKVG